MLSLANSLQTIPVYWCLYCSLFYRKIWLLLIAIPPSIPAGSSKKHLLFRWQRINILSYRMSNVSFIDCTTLSKLFYLQKQMLLLYIDIYTGKTENKKDHLALLDQCLPTVQSLLTMSIFSSIVLSSLESKWIKSYGQILLVFLTLYRMTLEGILLFFYWIL